MKVNCSVMVMVCVFALDDSVFCFSALFSVPAVDICALSRPRTLCLFSLSQAFLCSLHISKLILPVSSADYLPGQEAERERH